MTKAYIDRSGEVYRYFDKNGVELKDGDTVVYDDGRVEKLYLTDRGYLGTDATSKLWIQQGRAVPCEYGIYPLELSELSNLQKKEI